MFDFNTSEGILNFIGFLVKIGLVIEPAIVNLYNDWKNGKTTAEEVEAQAADKFAALRALLVDPHADARKLNAEEDAKLDAKFPQAAGNKEEPTT